VQGGAIYFESTFPGQHVDWRVLASHTEATTGSAAAGAVEAIVNFNPDVTLYVGIAGGIAEKGVKLGDVVAATEVFDYDGGKEAKNGFIPRTKQLHSAFALKQLAAATMIEDSWRARIEVVDGVPDLGQPVVHIDPIAAGSKVIANKKSDTYKLVRQTADRAVAVEMEGSGFLGAVQRFGDKATVIRGVSDLIVGKEASDKAGVRLQAVKNATAFAIELLYGFMPEPQRRAP
jgi:nucleoside phosphorylase